MASSTHNQKYYTMNTPMKKTIRRISVMAGATAFCLVLVSTVQAEDSTNRGQLSSRDYKFATEALKGGTQEVSLGQLAIQKASDPSVRDFGQRMVTDHQKANQALAQLLTQKGAVLPDTMAKKTEKMAEKLQGEAGTDFDKTYIKRMVKDHKEDVEDFQKEIEKGDDPDLKSWVTQTLPTVQEHLQVAESLEKGVTSQKS